MDNAHILIVDDLPTNRMLLKAALEPAGYSFCEAEDGEQALLEIERDSFDLIITDYLMPNLDGFGLLKKVRERFPEEQLPVIVVSGEEEGVMSEEFINAGASDYVIKPYDFVVLAARTKNIVSLKKTRDRLRTLDL